MRQLIKNVSIVTMNPKEEEFANGYVLLEEDEIRQVGAMTDNLPFAEKVIDGKNGILIPGMINTHTHTGMIPFRSLGDDVPDRLRRFLFPLEKVMTAELAKTSAKYATAEMLLSGITSFCDMYYFEDAIAEAVDEMGARAILGETIIEMPTCDFETPEDALEWCPNFINKWQSHPLITPAIAPHATNTVSPKNLKEIVNLSRQYDVPITMHVAEMTYEMAAFADKYQQTPIAFLKELGYFDRQFIMAHCIFAEESDFELFTNDGQIFVAHCIGANTKSAKGVAPVKKMLKNGWHVGLGTDGPSSGNTLDLFTQMRMFANFHKTIEQDRSLFSAKEILQLATIGGAKVLGLDRIIGSIEVGKKADLTLIETESINMFPIFDYYSALVYSANASNVSDVWVNGSHLVQNKHLIQQDIKQLRSHLLANMAQFIEEAEKRQKEVIDK